MSIEILNADNLAQFETQPNRVLILGKSDCENCKNWQEELNSAIESGGFQPEVSIGKLDLDQRGLGDFKKSNPWLVDVKDLPFNVIYKQNEIQKSYAGGGLDRLVNRLKRLELSSPG